MNTNNAAVKHTSSMRGMSERIHREGPKASLRDQDCHSSACNRECEALHNDVLNQAARRSHRLLRGSQSPAGGLLPATIMLLTLTQQIASSTTAAANTNWSATALFRSLVRAAGSQRPGAQCSSSRRDWMTLSSASARACAMFRLQPADADETVVSRPKILACQTNRFPDLDMDGSCHFMP